ncbi:MAG TPA: IS1634 family transposase [Polyangiaceae bacterium]|nr:IS1634 family transposase [Polyangiaceae bacterium]
MPRRSGPVHVVTTTRRYKGRTYHTHLLRRSYREDGKVKNETLGNLSHLPDPVIGLIRQALSGQTFVTAEDRFEIVASRAHGHVEAVLTAMRRLRIDKLLHSRPSRERELCLAMIAARVLQPQSKLATTRWWSTTTLPDVLSGNHASEDELYRAMDWLLNRQDAIEKKLAKRHLTEGGTALFDLSSSYFEGSQCPLAALGHNRDGKKGKLQVNYGLMTDGQGCPVSVSVVSGNTSDPKTLLPQVKRVRERFGIRNLVLVGDRGMISKKQIDSLREQEGIEWITALRSGSIRKLLGAGAIQMELFDERNLFELEHADFPGERLVACRNPALAERRRAKRRELIEATEKELEKVAGMVRRGRLRREREIGLRVGKVLNKYKVGKHFNLTIEEGRFEYEVDRIRVETEAALDGIYVIRTSLGQDQLSAEDAVRSYKSLSQVERAFRSFKTLDLHVRPIRHWAEGRVRSHIFLCMLAYYVQWHMQEVWRPLLFFDEDLEAKQSRDPVAPAERSAGARKKARRHVLEDGRPVHSFRTLLASLGTIVRNTCRVKDRSGQPSFELTTQASPEQRRALDLLKQIAV